MTLFLRIAYWLIHKYGVERLPLYQRADLLYHLHAAVRDGVRVYQAQVLERAYTLPDAPEPFTSSTLSSHVPFILEQSVRGITDHAISLVSHDPVEGAALSHVLLDMRKDELRKSTWSIAEAQRREQHTPHERSEDRLPPTAGGEGENPRAPLGGTP